MQILNIKNLSQPKETTSNGVSFVPTMLYSIATIEQEKHSLDNTRHLSAFKGKNTETLMNLLCGHERTYSIHKICPKPIGKGYDSSSINCAVLMGYFVKDVITGKYYFSEATGFERKSIDSEEETTIETKENKEFMQLHRFYASLFPKNYDAWNEWKKRITLGFNDTREEKSIYNFHWTKALMAQVDNKSSLFMSTKLETHNINDAIVDYYDNLFNA